MTKLTSTILLGIAALTATAALAASAPPKAKKSPAQAQAAALKKIPGKATSVKYEFEDKHWQYAVGVTDKKGQMWEVEVNATTGQVTDTEKTSAAEEASEAAADKKAAGEKGEKPD